MIAFPFDSRIVSYDADGLPIYDRASNAEHFAKLLSSFLCNGIFGSEMCEVLVSDGMSVTVGAGNLLINGRFGNIQVPETVTFEASEGVPRIDTVVLRLDLSSDVNFIVTGIVKGTAAENPAAPALTRDGTVWELGIANVLIPANSTAVSQANITDTRLNDQSCGLVAAILTDIDTTHLYDQIQADMTYFKEVEQEAFESWFDGIQGLLEGDVAANLAAQVNKKMGGAGTSLLIPADGWMGDGPFTQDIIVSKATADASLCHILLSDHPDYEEAFATCRLKAIAQGDGFVTMRVETKPSEAFYANLLVLLQGVGA